MNKRFIQIAALSGAFSVILGAFGAHGLKKILEPADLAIFEVAVRYQFYHVFALLLVGILYKEYPGKLLNYAGNFFIAGVCLFSGSLYLLIFLQANNISWASKAGAITPLGGVCLIIGWILMALSIAKKK